MGLATVKILIISNISSTKKSLKNALIDDFDLIFVDSIDEALSQLRKKLVEAIILDPSENKDASYHFIDKVRNNPVTRNLPFIIVSRESENLFVLRAVRAGISHFIGIPFEPKMLLEKVYFALTAKAGPRHQSYFELPEKLNCQITSFGRISYISEQGIHFETHIKFSADEKISFSSPLTEELKVSSLEIKVVSIGSDTYYNYPFSIDAEWTSDEIRAKVKSWILQHQHLNSPKKSKILLCHPDLSFEEKFVNQINLSTYSVRFSAGLLNTIEVIPFMRPAALIISAAELENHNQTIQQKLFTLLDKQKIPLVIFGDSKSLTDIKVNYFHSPNEIASIVMAVEKACPPKTSDPNYLYFSKTLEDSRLKIFIDGKTIVLGELGIKLALSHEVSAPCNFQLNLKIFSEQNLRNPFVRAWPPVVRLSTADSEKGKYKCSVETHFLGINDQQGQAIRQWLREEELKPKKEIIKSILPT